MNPHSRVFVVGRRGVVGFEDSIATDPSKPDGTPRKLLDVSRLEAMGRKARIGLREGVADACAWYLGNAATLRT